MDNSLQTEYPKIVAINTLLKTYGTGGGSTVVIQWLFSIKDSPASKIRDLSFELPTAEPVTAFLERLTKLLNSTVTISRPPNARRPGPKPLVLDEGEAI